ncbi:MAG: outer membrane protein assembly factor BamA [Kiritimatiellae bacterium]|nr:outer membrane protein assembly factor BamA [Kiritimatiellia bacterium]
MKKLVLVAAIFAAAVGLQAAKVVNVTARSSRAGDASLSGVTARCEVKVGMEYDPAACARDVKSLRDAGEYEDISVEASHVDGGIEIVYVITPKPRYHGPLNCKGNTYWNASKIAKFADLKDGYAYGDADFAAAANRIRTEYRKKEFADVKVTPVVEPIAGSDGAVTVTMVIEEGKRCEIDQYLFEGNANAEADALRETFGSFPWWNPIGWFTDAPVTAQDLAEARDKIAEYYRNLGYLDVEVMPAERVAAKKDGEVNILFKIAEGQRYKVGSITVVGIKNYPEAAVLGSVKAVSKGSVASEKALKDAAREIEIFCGSGKNPLAETRVEIKHVPVENDPDSLNVIFDVTEGVPVAIDRVLIRGNDYTKDKVIRREISLSPGDPMVENKAEQSKRRLENLRYFDRVRYYLEKKPGLVAESGKPEVRDLVYEVSEKNTGQFMIGIGASSVDSVYGTVELSESNFDLFNPWRFRGGGQKGRMLLQAGPRYQTYEVSVTEPYLFDRTLELTVDAYRRQRWYDDFDIIRNGASATIAYPVKFWPTAKTMGRLGFRLAAEFIEFDDVEETEYYLEKGFGKYASGSTGPVFKWQEEEYGDAFEIPLRVFWEDDTRDTFRFATRGHKVSVYGDLVGGDNNYWKVGFNFRKYLQVWKKYNHVLAFGVRGDTLDAFSDDVPIYNKLFLGGPRSIRGVEYRDVAPRVWSKKDKKGGYAAWGGQTSWCINAEYTVPIVKYVRLAGFTDLGAVGEDEFDFNTDYFCWSVGLGIRLDIESFPIRLDFAVPVVEPDDDVEKECFSFTVGYDF